MNMQTKPVAAALSTRAMIVTLSISNWSGRRYDAGASDEINQAKNASKDASRVNKMLLSASALQGIWKVVSSARSEFVERTLPWMDNGSRIMAADGFIEHTRWFQKIKTDFETQVAMFMGTYPTYLSEASTRLGQLYKAEDYPNVAELQSRFGMAMRVMPVPSSEDFRVDISEDQADVIRSQIEHDLGEATRSAVGDVYRRIHEKLEVMNEKLTNYKPAMRKGQKSEGIFRDSLVENMRDLVSLMPSLNITGDPELFRLANELKDVTAYDADRLRNNSRLRESTAARAKEIMDTMSDLYA